MSSRSNNAPRRRRYAAVAVGLVCGLALVEIVLRVVPVPAVELHRRGPVTFEDHRRFFVYDSELGWRGRAGAHGPFAGWEFTTDVRLDEHGFRLARTWRDKRPGQYEVLLVGDSITWGYGVEEDRRYATLLEAELAKLGVDAAIRNVAVPGYDTGQELVLYRRLRGTVCPDLVLIGLYANDVWENVSSMQGPYAKPLFRLTEDGVELTAAVPMKTERHAPLRGNARPDQTWMKQHVRLYALAAWVKEALSRPLRATASAAEADERSGVSLTAALLRALDDAVRADGARLGVLVLPAMEEMTKRGPSASETAATQSGVEAVLRLREAFRTASADGDGRPLFFRLDGAHWTERAHDIAARALAQWLVKQALLQGTPRRCAATVDRGKT